MPRPIITLLTDFGTTNHYVAALKGRILSICLEVNLVDITHEIAPWQIREAAFELAMAWHHFPAGTIHLAIVAPRRPIVAAAAGHYFVAPDNGVITMAVPDPSMREVADLATAAAQLAQETLPGNPGPEVIDPVRLRVPVPTLNKDGNWQGEVLHVDRFGNVITSFRSDAFPQVIRAASYSDVRSGRLGVLDGSTGFLEVSSNQSDAGKIADMQVGAAIVLVRGTLVKG